MIWPRIVELVLGCWLIISPFIFHKNPSPAAAWASHAAGAAIVVIALASIVQRWQRPFRWLNAGIAVALGLYGYVQVSRVDALQVPTYENFIVISLLLLLHLILPHPADRPPRAWRRPTT